MIKKIVEIDLTGTEFYVVQEIQTDSLGGIIASSVVAKSSYSEACDYIKYQIAKIKDTVAKNGSVVYSDKLKDRYIIRYSYDNEIIKGDFTIVYAITKLFL